MGTYIYESPDGGKTVTRRKWGDAGMEKDYLFRVNVGPNNSREEVWTPKSTVIDIMENAFHESLVREKYPAVREAYEQYQALLEICKQHEIGNN